MAAFIHLLPVHYQQREGHEHQQGHVVGEEHGGDEDYRDKEEGEPSHVAAASLQPVSDIGEHAAGLETFADAHQTEEQSQRPVVRVAGPFGRRRVEQRRHECGEQGYAEYRLSLEE